jgi:hypothetical protein
MSSFEPIPLAVGFTGHRDISPDDESKLREALKQRLKRLQTASRSTPLRVFTGLAEGGDMLFAEAAAELGIEIIAVMPVEVAEFARDFEKPAHPDRKTEDLLRRFETLRQKAARVHVVPLRPGVSPETVKSYGPERDGQYTAVGAYIVRQSAILIALWDGVATDKPGGTSDIVRFKRDGVPPQPGETEYFPAPPDGGPVMQLGTTRIDSMGGAEPSWRADSYPEPERPYRTEFNKALARLNDFNRDALAFGLRHPEDVATSRRYLLPADVELDPAAERVVHAYAVSDALAISFQKKAHHVLAAIIGLAVLMVICFEFYEHLWPTELWLMGYVLAFGAAYVIYLFELWRQTYPRFLDYRCLAEGLRVEIFWHLAGLNEAVADHYLYRQRGELRWIRDALRSFMVHMTVAQPRLDLVRKHWIGDQGRYFAKAADRSEHDERRARRWSDILFGIGFGIALVLAAIGLLKLSLPEEAWRAMILLVAFLPALAAAIKGYAVKRAFSEQAKQYARMGRVFSLARKRLESVNDKTLTERTRGVLLALGREALAENAEWILLHRERQIEPPT